MPAFFDSNNNPVPSLNLVQVENSEQAFVLKVRARTGFYLKAEVNQTVAISARRAGTNAAFQDLSISPFALTPFANQTIEVEFKLKTNQVSDIANVALPIRYTAAI